MMMMMVLHPPDYSDDLLRSIRVPWPLPVLTAWGRLAKVVLLDLSGLGWLPARSPVGVEENVRQQNFGSCIPTPHTRSKPLSSHPCGPRSVLSNGS